MQKHPISWNNNGNNSYNWNEVSESIKNVDNLFRMDDEDKNFQIGNIIYYEGTRKGCHGHKKFFSKIDHLTKTGMNITILNTEINEPNVIFSHSGQELRGLTRRPFYIVKDYPTPIIQPLADADYAEDMLKAKTDAELEEIKSTFFLQSELGIAKQSALKKSEKELEEIKNELKKKMIEIREIKYEIEVGSKPTDDEYKSILKAKFAALIAEGKIEEAFELSATANSASKVKVKYEVGYLSGYPNGLDKSLRKHESHGKAMEQAIIAQNKGIKVGGITHSYTRGTMFYTLRKGNALNPNPPSGHNSGNTQTSYILN